MIHEDELNTVVVEFTCPSEKASGPDNPVEQLVEIFRKTKLRFASEEYRISREELLTHPDWSQWRESHEGEVPDEVTTFVFLSSEENRPVFGRLFEGWMREQEQRAKKQGG
jgi:hypothetical protein